METSVNSSARSPVRAMMSGLCSRTSASRYRLPASKRLPCRSEICTTRSPENAAGSAALQTSTVLEDSVKFSNHAAPASTSAAGSSQRRQLFRPFFPMPAPPFSIVYHTRPAKKSRTVAPAGHFCAVMGEKTASGGAVSHILYCDIPSMML